MAAAEGDAVPTAAAAAALSADGVARELLSQLLPFACYALLAYSDDKHEEQMKEFAKTHSVEFQPEVHAVQLLRDSDDALIGSIKFDTEALLVLATGTDGKGQLVVAFRGTETTSGSGVVSDILTDLSATLDPLSDLAGATETMPGSDTQVHSGFLGAFNSIARQDLDLSVDLASIANKMGADCGVKIERVVCTGHSLGGALATLGAYWAKHVAFPEAEVACYTFGSPRVGNDEFAAAFAASIPECYRCIHADDPVTAVPVLPGFNYKHVDKPVRLRRTSSEDGDSEPAYVAKFERQPVVPNPTKVGDHPIRGYVNAIRRTLGMGTIDFSKPIGVE